MVLGHGICSWDMGFALWTWDMLYGHGICSMDMGYALGAREMSSCGTLGSGTRGTWDNLLFGTRQACSLLLAPLCLSLSLSQSLSYKDRLYGTNTKHIFLGNVFETSFLKNARKMYVA